MNTPTDNVSVHTTPESGRRRLAPLIVISLVSSLIMLDSNIVAVSLLAIGRSFETTFTGLQWVVSAYVLAFCSCLLAVGSWADLRGRKRAMIIGLSVFGVASVGCGLAPSLLVLELSRGLQGVGASFLLTSTLAIISHDYQGAERAKAFAIWGASIGAALAAGPIVGGIITQLFGWRPVFLINIPICSVLLIAALSTLKESRNPKAHALDFPGVISFSIALGLLVDALIAGNDRGWSNPIILAQLTGSAAVFILFGRIESRKKGPMIDLWLFRTRAFLGGIITMTGYGATMQVLIFLMPLYLQTVYGLTPITAGLAMIPYAFPMVVAPQFASRLAHYMSMPSMLALGLVLGAAGQIIVAAVSFEMLPYVLFAVGLVLAGCGAGLLNGLTVKAVQASVPEERAGMASGMAATSRFTGLLIGIAVLGAVLADRTQALFVPQAQSQGVPIGAAQELSRKLVSGELPPSGAASGTGASLFDSAIAAYAGGFAASMLVAALIAVVTALFAIRLLREPKSEPLVIQPCMPVDCRHPI